VARRLERVARCRCQRSHAITCGRSARTTFPGFGLPRSGILTPAGRRETQVDRWALEGSNLRPSPCKGDALPAELSARAFRACRVPAGPAHDLAEHRREARPSADLAPVQARCPVGPVALALGAHQRLPPGGHRPHPRRPSLVGIVGGTAAKGTPRPVARRRRSVQRPHGLPGYALRLRCWRTKK
jgi:hypothetical protein